MSVKGVMKSKVFLAIVNFIMVLLIGFFDYRTGIELNVTILYLVPICIITWYLGEIVGIITADLCAGVYLASDLIGRHVYTNNLIACWNALMYLAFFSVVAYILSRLKKTIQREKNLARIDFLTDIPNLKGFYEFGEREIEKCKRYNRKLSLAYVDCDNFKQVNDTCGHEAGDKLLKLIAETIQDSIRNTDLVARLGGDEFVVMFDETGIDTVHNVLDRVDKNLKEAVKRENFNVTFSVGVAIFDKVPDTLEEAVKKADELMYAVKRTGKNMVKYQLLS